MDGFTMIEGIEYRHFYLDSNFFWTLCKDPTGVKIDNWNKALEKLKIVPQQKLVHFIGTPFMLLEAIGSPHKKIQIQNPKVNSNLLKSGSIEELKKYLYDFSHKIFSENLILQPESILKMIQEQMDYATPFGKSFFEKVICHNTRIGGFESEIYQHLAFDYVQKFNYPKEIMDEALASFTVDIIRGTSHNWNLSQARLIAQRWKQIGLELIKLGHISREAFEKASNEDYCYKFSSDIVDTEVTHFSVIGYLERSKLYPTVCFTSDPVKKMRFRSGIYRMLAQDALERIHEQEILTGKPLPFKPLDQQSGLICICDNKTGDITECIEIEKIDNIEI